MAQSKSTGQQKVNALTLTNTSNNLQI